MKITYNKEENVFEEDNKFEIFIIVCGVVVSILIIFTAIGQVLC